MAFVLSVLYVALSLLSPGVLPEAVSSLHVNIILGIATILALIPRLGGARLGSLQDSYLVAGLLFCIALSCIPLGFSTIPGKIMGYFPILITYYFVLIGCRNLFQLKVLIYVLLGVALFILLQAGIADHAHEVISPYLVPERMGENLVNRYRGMGVLADPNDLAEFYATLVPMLFIRWKKGASFSNFLFTLLPAAVLVVGMYYTHSRGGAIALVAVCVFGFKDKLGVTLSSILAVVLFAGMIVLNISGGRGMNDDDGGRVAAWATGLKLFETHPVIGVGIDQFPEYNETGQTAHNSYVLCLAELGALGYFCWMGTIVSNLTGLTQIAKTSKGGTPSAEDKQQVLQPHTNTRWRPATGFRANAFSVSAMQAAVVTGPSVTGVAAEEPTALSWVPPGAQITSFHERGDSEADLARTARVMRIAFVGLLTSAFFLSRSFSMIFYVVLGMSASLRMLYLAKHPDHQADLKAWLRRVMLALVGSVVFLYLFVRIRGVH